MHDFSAIARQISFDALEIELSGQDVEILARFIPMADALILKASLRELRGAVKNGVPECQSARNVDPLSASNIHPPVGDQRLACPALAGVAEGRPSAGDGYLRL